MKRLAILTAAWLLVPFSVYMFAQTTSPIDGSSIVESSSIAESTLRGRTTSTNPVDYTSIVESTRRGGTIELGATFGEIDDQSLLEVQFDESRMAPLLVEDGQQVRQVEIRVEAFQTRNGVQSPIAPIDNYVSRQTSRQPVGAGGAPAGNVAVAYVFNDKPYDGDLYRLVPDTVLNLTALGVNDADQIEIRVTNLATQETLVRILTPRAFGFRVDVTDSLLFLKRLYVSQQDRKDGVDAVNFGPAPGVTYGGTYLSRGNGFLRFLQPGVGLTVSFMNWTDPAFDLTTGKFVSGTKSSDVNIGMGAQLSLFNNVLLFSFGANLQAEQNRRYFGVGVSFVNLGGRIGQLIP